MNMSNFSRQEGHAVEEYVLIRQPSGRAWLKVDEDGTQYLLIREAPSAARSRPVRHWVSTFAESLTILKVGFQKALRFASRRA
jgi:hypothetical protein